MSWLLLAPSAIAGWTIEGQFPRCVWNKFPNWNCAHNSLHFNDATEQWHLGDLGGDFGGDQNFEASRTERLVGDDAGDSPLPSHLLVLSVVERPIINLLASLWQFCICFPSVSVLYTISTTHTYVYVLAWRNQITPKCGFWGHCSDAPTATDGLTWLQMRKNKLIACSL